MDRPRDGWLVREISAASPGIFAASYDNAGQRQDYDNDLNALAAAGLTGAHFDSFSGQDRYHTLRDNLASADQRALQDVGDAMLALTRHFGDIPIGETKAEDEVFFTLFGSGILHYPLAWALPLGLAGLGTASVIALGLWRGRRARAPWRGDAGARARRRGRRRRRPTYVAQLIPRCAPRIPGLRRARLLRPGLLHGRPVCVHGGGDSRAMVPDRTRRLEAAYVAVAALVWVGVLAVFFALASPSASFVVTWPALAGV